MRPWMIVAEPLILGDAVCEAAAKNWNAVWVRERLNRYWSYMSAEADAADHNARWGQWVRFTVVRRKTFWQGWR